MKEKQKWWERKSLVNDTLLDQEVKLANLRWSQIKEDLETVQLELVALDGKYNKVKKKNKKLKKQNKKLKRRLLK
tara:strand:- start:14381 stop:14605 length:225 start_codon:yes stop_codon:yes gene_type:complete